MSIIKRRRFLEIFVGTTTTTFLGNALQSAIAALPKYQWILKIDKAPWHKRDGAGLLWFKGRLFILGGWDGTNYPYSNPSDPSKPIHEGVPAWGRQRTTNEIWSSRDGVRWDLILPHTANPPATGVGARWRPRHTAGWLVHKNQIFVIGGDHLDITGLIPQDVWSSPDGTTWIQQTAKAAPFDPAALPIPGHRRILHSVGTYNNKLWLFGGQTDLGNPSTALNDLWSSSDSGKTWKCEVKHNPSAKNQPKPRGMIYTLVEWKGYLWLCGGGTYNSTPESRTYYNDVWRYSEKGRWEQILPNEIGRSNDRWSPRQYHNVIAYDDKLWVMSGFGYNRSEKAPGLKDVKISNLKDVWVTTDGKKWQQAFKDEEILWAPGHADGVCVSPEGLWKATGNGTLETGIRDVYLLKK
jgi:hypothetical protein